MTPESSGINPQPYYPPPPPPQQQQPSSGK